MRVAPCLLVVVACGAPHPTTTAEAPDSTGAAIHAGLVEGPGAGPAASDCSAWPTWIKVNEARVRSRGHGGKWVDVYVESGFVDAYRDRSGPAPVGMRVVKAGYEDEAGTRFQALTVMGKMPPGYDRARGDWYYGVLGRDGRTATMQGRLGMCIDCHDQAADRDYLFGIGGD